MVCAGIDISANVGDTVSGSARLVGGKEIDYSTQGTVVKDPVNFPYTFVHATATIGDGVSLENVQRFDLSIAPAQGVAAGNGYTGGYGRHILRAWMSRVVLPFHSRETRCTITPRHARRLREVLPCGCHSI